MSLFVYIVMLDIPRISEFYLFIVSLTIVMQLWDGLSDSGARVMVIGATNRPQDLDPAIQRRFERSLLLSYPDLARMLIFQALLQECVVEKNFRFDVCAELTEGYSSSDILAVCKAAAVKRRSAVVRKVLLLLLLLLRFFCRTITWEHLNIFLVLTQNSIRILCMLIFDFITCLFSKLFVDFIIVL